MSTTTDTVDNKCNRLFRQLDYLKAAGKDGSSEYMAVLYKLKSATAERVASLRPRLLATAA